MLRGKFLRPGVDAGHIGEVQLPAHRLQELDALVQGVQQRQADGGLQHPQGQTGKTGTGAGFPGLPLRVLEPSIRLTLLDSLNKRIQFLETVCRELDLPDVACVHARAEEFAAEHRETFDLAVSRAVAALPVLCELCLPLVKPGGKFLAMKSVESDAELAASQHAIAILGGAVEAVRDYAIPGTDVRHRLIVVEKVKKTPEKYPRMFAKIKKNPL